MNSCELKIPRIVLAGTTSGVGKTSITCAIIYGFRKRGFSVQPYKVGPDYIDPSYLSSISKNETCNLDVWLMGKHALIKSFVKNSTSDISIIEGVMGYYDGFDGKSNLASTHQIAEFTKSPTILVLDASKTARSIAATALGFLKFHKNSRIKGIILNKIGSKKHENLCRQALKKTRLSIVGIIPRNNEFDLESRHLGLIPTIENKQVQKKIQIIAKSISDYIDIDKIINISKNVSNLQRLPDKKQLKQKTTIGIALDSSFNFYYKDNLDALRREGAKLEFFSPISNKKLPKINGLYIGGGFPEILGSKLENNSSMKSIIKKRSEDCMPVYAECGGLMYLTTSIDYGSKKFKMVGLFDAETKMTKKMILNYTKGSTIKNSIISPKLKKFHGHEFHYSKLENVSSDSKYAYTLDIGEGIKNHKDGLVLYNTVASYGHFYFDYSHFAKNFVNTCIKESRR